MDVGSLPPPSKQGLYRDDRNQDSRYQELRQRQVDHRRYQEQRRRTKYRSQQEYRDYANDGYAQDGDGYLTKLTGSLAASMIEPQHAIAMDVTADAGTLPSAEAVSIGLIVTELVINAVKYAFPTKRKEASILITFRFDGSD